MGPLRIIEYLLLLGLVVGYGYLNYQNGVLSSYAGGFIFPLIVIILPFIEDRK